MKHRTLIYTAVLLFTTVVLLWAIPQLVRTATKSADRYPFAYFSSIYKKLMFREFDGRIGKLHDDEGNIYSDEAFDAALPLLNYRQLTVNGEMPDSIDGIAVDPRELRVKQVFYRYSPTDKYTPDMGLYIMYESMPKKAKLESPGDVFRWTNQIEFMDAATNSLNAAKSELFTQALLNTGYTFPSRGVYGNLSIRKPYDEGYFSIDAAGKFFHLKMVNGQPFVRDTHLPDSIRPVFFAMQEVTDKRFYGYLFADNGSMYILEEHGGKYEPLRLDIAPVNPATDEVVILGNPMYWTVMVEKPQGKHYYALQTASLQQVRHAYVEATPDNWASISSKLFPCYLTLKSADSHFLRPELHFGGWQVWGVNLVLAIVFALIVPRRPMRQRSFESLFVLLFGVAGAVALLLQWRK